MRKRIILIMAIVCILMMTGCGASKIMSESHSLTLGELKESEDKWGYCWRVSSMRTIIEAGNQYAVIAAFGE